MFCGHLAQGTDHGFQIRLVRHPDVHVQPDFLVAVRPVLQLRRNKLRIRRDHRNVVQSANRRRAHFDFHDLSLLTAHRDPVPNLDRSLDKQDKTGDEVGSDVLQSKSDADR